MALKLARLNTSAPIIGQAGAPNSTLIGWWNDICTALETALNTLTGQVSAIEAAQAAAAQAQTAATVAQTAASTAHNAAVTAQDAASTAQGTANTVTGFAALQGSYVSPTNVLSAADAGASATITIAGHNRIYGDGTTVAVTGGALTGLAYSTAFSVYYDQPSRAGGAVTYHSTADPATASPSAGNPDRHFVGAVKTPAALGAAISGIGAVSPNVALPSGYFL